MYAVIRTGGKQYRVSEGDEIRVEKLDAEAGADVTFDDVLMIGGDGAPTLDADALKAATVAGSIVDQTRSRKVLVFKKRRRTNYRRKNGHRQHLTVVKIGAISASGAKSEAKKAKAAAPVEAEAAPAAQGG